jgi:hypothetical protein
VSRSIVYLMMRVPFEIVRAGLHWSRRMSKQMLPFELMFG